MKISIRHARSVNYCAVGMRAFAKRHDLDFHAFCHEGIEEELLLATGDAMAEKIVQEAKGEKNGK